MDINLAVLGGRLAAPGEHRTFPSGAAYLRLLVTVRSTEPRRRVDVIPVTLWDPPDGLVESTRQAGRRIWVAASVQRRFWADGEGRRSRLELTAHHVELRDEPADAGASVADTGG